MRKIIAVSMLALHKYAIVKSGLAIVTLQHDYDYVTTEGN